jgi:phosphomannomutase
MNLAMKQLRQELPSKIADQPVVKVLDRLSGEVRDGQTGQLIEKRDWDKGDMLTFFFSQDERNALHVRPSGTEPKMKYYTMIKGNLSEFSKKELELQAEAIEQAIVKEFEAILSRIKVDVFH